MSAERAGSVGKQQAGGRPSGCINRPTILGLALGACALIAILLMVQWVDLLAAERRASRLVTSLQTAGRGDGSSIHTLPRQEQLQRPMGGFTPGFSDRPVGVVLQRTVALIPFGETAFGETRGILVRDLGLGVQFDLSPIVGVVVSAVDMAVAAESGLAVGDRVISLAGVAVAADHDPLAALDEAEDAIRGQFLSTRTCVLIQACVAPSLYFTLASNNTLTLLSSCPDQQATAAAAALPRPAVIVVAAPVFQQVEHGVVAAPRFGKASNLGADGKG
jgi:hypothetical protein